MTYQLEARYPKLFSKHNDWIRLIYFDRYGLTTIRAQSWLKRAVVIGSIGGYWRFDSQSYTPYRTHAGIFTMREAYKRTKGLGREKHVTFYDVSQGLST